MPQSREAGRNGPPAFDPEQIARTLGAELERSPSGDPEMTLRDETSGVSVRLTLHHDRAAASFYVRAGQHFAGFLHIAAVERVELKPDRREVHFITRRGQTPCRFAVSATGQFLALAGEETPVEEGR